jgi:glyoxylate/hydroxypyruvate reductase A
MGERRVILYVGMESRGREWARITGETTDDLELRVWPEIGRAEEVEYLAAWTLPDGLIARLPRLRAVLSVGAGVDQLDLSAIPVELPLARMKLPEIVVSVTNYVAMAVLALHRDLPDYIAQRHTGVLRRFPVRLPAERRVGVLGLGEVGGAAAAALAGLGFAVSGWSRTAKRIAGVASFTGVDGLAAMLAQTDILVCLLPLTAATRGILCADTFARLPRGAALVNAARGAHLVEADLLAALDTGQIATAMLDVTEPEPLPAGHPFWTHPRVVLTPHVGAVTQVEAGIAAVLANIRRFERGETLTGLIDRARGY